MGRSSRSRLVTFVMEPAIAAVTAPIAAVASPAGVTSCASELPTIGILPAAP